MPFKSKAQQRYMFAAEARGDIKEGTAERFAKETPDIKSLPKKAPKKKPPRHRSVSDLVATRKAKYGS